MSMNEDPTASIPPPEPEVPAQLREAAERGRKAQRELAFVKAGIDTDSPAGQMFMTSFQGDPSDRQAIADGWKALEAQFAPKAQEEPPPPAAPVATEEQLAQQQAVEQFGHEQVRPDERPQANPIDEGYNAFFASQAAGATRQEASAEITQRLIDGAVHGDERLIWKGHSPEALDAARVADGMSG